VPRPSMLRCSTCGAEYPPGPGLQTCRQCGPLLGTLEAVWAPLRLDVGDVASMWRYADLLPLDGPPPPGLLPVGWTPLVSVPSLAARAGVARVFVKWEGSNPSGSLKDRASAVAVAQAKEEGFRTLVVASTGNAAASAAALCASVALRCVVIVPQGTDRARLAHMACCGAVVVEVRGSYDQAFELSMEVSRRWGWYCRSTAVNPYLAEGKKTVALEVAEQLGWEAPDVVVVPVGDGCIMAGVAKAFRELEGARLVSELPRLVGVQASGCAPLVRAWRRGEPRAHVVQPRTMASSLAVAVPRDQVKALRAVRESGGVFVAVDDEEMAGAVVGLGRSCGLYAELAGAAPLAALMRLAEEGGVRRTDTVVLLATGTGFKNPPAVVERWSAEPLLTGPSLAEFARSLERAEIEP
jgi:threonine synthase